MSTRSAIGVMHGDKCKAIYSHSDGYLEYVGQTLFKYYDSAKANFLVAQGDMSMLGKEIGEKIDFNDRMEYDTDGIAKQCRFYKRDRDEQNVDFKVFFNDQELFGGIDAEYFYVMKDGVWYVSEGAEWKLLSQALSELNIIETSMTEQKVLSTIIGNIQQLEA
jgi:hypothetical protein